MTFVVLSEKGQVTIPQQFRKAMHVSRGDALVVEQAPGGGILLRPAAVLPIETYSEERLSEFAKEDKPSAGERQRIQKALHAKTR
jgi:AbrB family looped-hinge helix DNA binding protein